MHGMGREPGGGTRSNPEGRGLVLNGVARKQWVGTPSHPKALLGPPVTRDGIDSAFELLDQTVRDLRTLALGLNAPAGLGRSVAVSDERDR